MLEEIQRTLRDARAKRESMRRSAQTHAAELAALKKRLVAAAHRAQEHEERVTALESRIAALHAEDARKSDALRDRREELARLLAALQRLSRHPPVALIALPGGPTDTVRSAILLRAAVPRLEARAAALGEDLSRLSGLRHEIAAERESLVRAGRKLAQERRQLAALIDRKLRLERQALAQSWAAGARIAELAAEARSLQELVDRLAKSRKRSRQASLPRRNQRSATPPSTARLPARGRIVRRFGRADGRGGAAKGVTIETRPEARVVAPGAGEVVFAGPFRGYGQLLIIEHGEGYHVLLAGMSRVDAVVGDEVLEGEPVGAMNPSPDLKPRLYIELRRNGRPVNPLPWIAVSKDKVSG